MDANGREFKKGREGTQGAQRSSIWCRLFGHSWRDVAVNAFGIEIEQRCARCRVYRHHFFVDAVPMDKPIRWRNGRRPNQIPETGNP